MGLNVLWNSKSFKNTQETQSSSNKNNGHNETALF